LLISEFIIGILLYIRRYLTKVLGTGLGRICGPNTEAVRGGGCKLRNGELYNLYCSPEFFLGYQVKHRGWIGYVERMGEISNVHNISSVSRREEPSRKT